MIQKKNVSKLLKKEDVSKSLGLHIQKTIEKENISKTLALHIQKTIEKEENLPLKDKQEKVSQNISFQCEKAPIALGSYRISSGYCSGRRHPVLGYVRAHRGIDFSARRGTSVSCVSPGRIKDILWNSSGFGLHVVVSHKNKIDTLYGHLSQFSKKIHKGKEIKAGEEIGCVGSSGLATGAHLHFEIRNQGIPQDPTPYLSRVIPNLSYKKNKNKIS
jgi:murein DD-endopeptidase MepM/ murein hydrolase activator NlpD